MRNAVLDALLLLAFAGCVQKSANSRQPSSVDSKIAYATDFAGERSAFRNAFEDLRHLYPTATFQSSKVATEKDSDLSIQSLYVPPARPSRNLIVLTAGIHGVEAPSGGYQERLLLDRCFARGRVDTKQTAILVIDSVNPFGFRYNRRVNGNNVDLNRNCFDYRIQDFPGRLYVNDYYEKYRSLLENPVGLVKLVPYAAYDTNGIKRALAGQYVSPKGIYFGGDRVQTECEIVQKLMDPAVREATNILHIDFHTGLGQAGFTQLMVNRPPNEEAAQSAYADELAFLSQTLFPEAECRGLCGIKKPEEQDFETTGDITQWIYNQYPEKRKHGRVLALTAETGTVGPFTALPALVNENYCHEHATGCDPKKAANFTDDLRKAFDPEDPAWRAKLESSAEQVCRALTRFSHLSH